LSGLAFGLFAFALLAVSIDVAPSETPGTAEPLTRKTLITGELPDTCRRDT